MTMDWLERDLAAAEAANPPPQPPPASLSESVGQASRIPPSFPRLGAIPQSMADLPSAGARHLPIVGPVLNMADMMRNAPVEGAPLNVRAVVGSMPEENRKAALQQFYPTVIDMGNGNFLFGKPGQDLQLYNPSGLDIGDVASLPAEGAEMAGGVGGGIVGALGGPWGVVAGAGAGATGARELVQRGVMSAAGIDDIRSPRQQALDAAITASLNMAGPAVASGVGAVGKRIVRGTLRGGARGRAGAAQAVDDLGRFGVAPSVAQATQNPMADAAESFLSRYPGSAGLIRRRARETAQQVARSLEDKTDNIIASPIPKHGPRRVILGEGDHARAAPPPVRARLEPDAVGRAISDDAGQYAGRFRNVADRLYRRVDTHISADAQVSAENTMDMLDDLSQVAPGAPRTSALLTNPAVKEVAAALRADLVEGRLPYVALSSIRSMVGRRMAGRSLHEQIPAGELKRLYGAITRDLEVAATAAGPQALAAFKRANTYYKRGIARIDDVLQPLIDQNVPEKLFYALERAGREGPSTLWQVRKSVSPEQWAALSGLVAKRLGRASAGKQDELGEAFSFETFLTNWNRLDPKARNALFGGQGTLRADLDALARATARMRESSRAFYNTSGTAQATMLQNVIGLAGTGVVAAPLTGLDSLWLPAAIAGGAVAANQSARLMTNPRFVKWLAQSTRIKPNGFSGQIARLAAVAADGDDQTRRDVRDYASALGIAVEKPATAPSMLSRPAGLPENARYSETDGKWYLPKPGSPGRWLEVVQ